jgi:energy-coupling factor transporter ATP-binding protein EcfA2
VLLLDEPTNDLDTETLAALEDAIENFAGCAVVISHDRFFLDRLATHILAFEGNSHVEWFEGNFEAYEEDKRRRLAAMRQAIGRRAWLYKKLTRFVDAGWRKGQAWGMAVSVPGTLNRASVGNRLTPPRCPRVFERFSRWMTVAEWRALGVVPMAAPALSDDTLAVLLEPDGPGRTGYLLTSNYEAILDYNCSNFYALSVGLLADGVAK